MLDRLFLRRLEDEVPRWVARGWLTSESGQLILADMAERAGAVRSPGLAFAVVGVILLGSGVITFFAANWPDLPRLFKLALVFGTLWGAHAGALALERRHYPRLAEAVALLTVLLFGAAIMLVAQMYHMGADPPAGVLLWTFGAIATAWVWRSGLCALAAYALAVLWLNVVDGGWSYGHHPIPWGFLGLWAALLPLVLRHRWRLPSHAAILSLLWWCAWALAEAADRYDGGMLEVTRVAAAGAVLALAVADSFHLPMVRRYALTGTLLGLMVLAIPALGAHVDGYSRWLDAAVGLAVVAVFLGVRGGAWEAVAAGAFVLLTSFGATVTRDAASVYLLVVNVLLLAGLLTMVWLAGKRQDRFALNVTFLTLAGLLLRFYFELFGSLMDRSLFFIAGGMLVLGMGWLMERQRRRLLHPESGEAAP